MDQTRLTPGRLTPPSLYVLGLIALGFAEVARGFSPAMFFLWGATCDLAGYALVAGLCGWAVFRFPRLRGWLRLPSESTARRFAWFSWAQACLGAVTVTLSVWIATDVAFEGLGEGVALFGLSGRMAACPAALMLIGASIVMAWQTTGRWRAGWQFAAMGCGVLFTGSVGWAGLDVAALSTSELWADRFVNLLISCSMMTLLTRFGLARFLAGSGDWIDRGRQASPVFGGLALAMALAVVTIFVWRFAASVV